MKLLQKYLTTASVYYCNVALGISATFMAPILLDFINAFETDTQSISLVLTICRAITLLSALAFGVIFNYVNRHLLVTLLVFLIGATAISLPYSTGLTLFSVLSVIQGISTGGYLTAQVVWIIEIWKDAAGPYIQAQHFFFALGTIFPPLIFAPFLSNNSDLENIDILTNYGNKFTSANATANLENVTPVINSLEKLYLPCGICGGIIAFGAVILLGNYYAFNGMPSTTSATESQETVVEPTDGEKKETKTDKIEGENVEENPSTNNSIKKIVLLILASSLIGGVESMEGITMTFLPVFGHFSDLHLSTVDGANILSAYSIAYTVGRFLGIVIILKLHARWILCGNIVLIALANLVLLFFGGTNLTTMYIGSILLGIGFSTSVPSVFAYAQLHLHVTNVVGSILMVAGGTVAAIFPVVIGSYIEETPSIFMYLNLGCVVVCLICLFSMVITMRNTLGKL